MIESVQRPASFVHSLERGLAVIRCFSAERPRLTLSDVARQTGLSRAAVRRSLITLQALGYVCSEERQFYLTRHKAISPTSPMRCTSPARPRCWMVSTSSTWRARPPNAS